MFKKIVGFVLKVAILCVVVWWLKNLYIEKFYNAPVAVADRLEQASAAMFQQKMLEAENLSEADKQIIMIDPAAGGLDNGCEVEGVYEKDITLRVALDAQKLIEESSDYVVFLTRTEDMSLSDRQRKELFNALRPQYYIRLEVGEDSNKDLFGIQVLYSDAYYNYELTNSTFAVMLEEKICYNANDKALGVCNISGDDNIWLKEKIIPSAIVKLGFLSNDKEREALSSAIYCKQLARGIQEAIIECNNGEETEEIN